LCRERTASDLGRSMVQYVSGKTSMDRIPLEIQNNYGGKETCQGLNKPERHWLEELWSQKECRNQLEIGGSNRSFKWQIDIIPVCGPKHAALLRR